MNRATPGTCVHYTGLHLGAGVGAECCGKGINYRQQFDGKRQGIALRMPCVQYRVKPAHGRGTYIAPGEPTIRQEIDRRGQTMIPCAHFEEPSPEQVEAARIELATAKDHAMIALDVAAKWRVVPKPAADRREVVECPVCHGKLQLVQFADNGHCHGQCETKGCLSWIE